MLRPKFWGAPVTSPDQIKPLLGRGIHWKKGRSAYEVANTWLNSRDMPRSVKKLLGTDPVLAGATLVEAFYERQTELDTLGRPTQTDLLALVKTSDGLAVLGIEGKVDEPFGRRVAEWDDGSPGKRQRLAGMLELLCIEREAASSLRCQLIHRTVATILEAEHYGARHGAVIVQSFDQDNTGLGDFQAFATVLGIHIIGPGVLSKAITRHKVNLRFGWAADRG